MAKLHLVTAAMLAALLVTPARATFYELADLRELSESPDAFRMYIVAVHDTVYIDDVAAYKRGGKRTVCVPPGTGTSALVEAVIDSMNAQSQYIDDNPRMPAAEFIRSVLQNAYPCDQGR